MIRDGYASDGCANLGKSCNQNMIGSANNKIYDLLELSDQMDDPWVGEPMISKGKFNIS